MLRPAQKVPTAALGSAFSMSASRPVRWLGRRGPGLPWQALNPVTSGPWQEIAACMLIANRSGAATAADIETFLRSVEQVAARLPAACGLPYAVEELARGETLDRFCLDLDVLTGLTL